MVYKHAYLDTLLLLHSTFILSVVKMPLKREAGGHALNSHGNYLVEYGKTWKNHGIVFLNFCGSRNSKTQFHDFYVFCPQVLQQKVKVH